MFVKILKLSIFQGIRYLLPLLLTPYFARSLTQDEFGLIIFGLSLIAWLSLLGECGFSLSITRKIAQNKCKAGYVSSVVSRVQGALVLSSLCTLLVTMSLVTFYPYAKGNEIFFVTCWLTASLQAALPYWYFNGVERVVYPSVFDALGYFVFVSVVILFKVHDPLSIIFVLLLVRLTILVCCNIEMYRKVAFIKINFTSSCKLILETKALLYSKIVTSTYTTFNPILLGMFVGPHIVGVFSSIDKIVRSSLAVLKPVVTAIYPRASSLFSKNINKAEEFVFFSGLFTILVGFIISIILFFGAENIIELYLGDKYFEYSNVLEIMAFIPFFISLSNVIGVQYILTQGRDVLFNIIVTSGAVFNIVLILCLVPDHGLLGIAYITLIIEVYISIVMLFFGIRLKKRRGK